MSWIFEPRILRMPQGDGGDGGGNPPPAGPNRRETGTVDNQAAQNSKEQSQTTQQTQEAQSRLNEDLRIGIERQIRANQLEEERLSILGQSLEAARTRLRIQTSQISNLEDLLKNSKKHMDSLEGSVNFAAKLNEHFAVTAEQMTENSEALSKFNALKEDTINKAKEHLDIIESAAATEAQKAAAEDALLEIYKKQGVEYEKLRGEMENVESFSLKIKSQMNSIGQSMGIQADMSNTVAGNFASMAADMATGLTKDKFAAIGQGLQQFAVGAIFSLVDKIGSMALELDKVGKQLQSTTGYTKNFNSQIMSITESTTTFGGTAQEASDAIGALSSNFTAFNPHADAANEVMGKNLVTLKKFGVSMSQAAQMTDQLSKAQGLSGEEASSMALRITTAGRNIGIESDKMAQAFIQSHDALVQFGDDADEIFIGMAAQAKAAGLEVSNLINVAKGFDTFKDAADKVGKLNAIMGTSLSAMELMNADYDDTIKLLREGTNFDFDSMNRFEKQYVASALGLQSVDEAQRLLTMSTDEYLSHQGKMEDQAATQKELADAAEKMVPVTQRLEIAFTKLVVAFAPAIEIFAGFLDIISEYPNLVMGIVTAIAAYTLYIKITNVLAIVRTALLLKQGVVENGMLWTMKMKQLSQKTGIAIDQLEIVIKGVMTKATFALAFAKYFLMGAVIALVLVFVYLIYVMTKPNSPPLYLIFGVIALGVIALGIALYFIQGPAQLTLLLLVGLAVGMSMMFYSIKLLVDSLTGFFEMLINNVESIPLVAAGLYMMAGAFAAMGIAAMLSLGSVVLLLAALTGVGAIFIGGMMLAGFKTLGGLANHMNMIGTGMERFALGLEKIKVVTSMLQQIGKDAFIAISVKGDTTTAVIAPKDMIPDISNGIDINIKVNVPQPIVYVNIDGKDIPSKVDKVRSTPSIFDKAVGNAMGAA